MSEDSGDMMGDENDFGMDSEGEQDQQVLNLDQEDDDDEYEPAI